MEKKLTKYQAILDKIMFSHEIVSSSEEDFGVTAKELGVVEKAINNHIESGGCLCKIHAHKFVMGLEVSTQAKLVAMGTVIEIEQQVEQEVIRRRYKKLESIIGDEIPSEVLEVIKAATESGIDPSQIQVMRIGKRPRIKKGE